MFLHKTKSIHFLKSLLPEHTLTWPSGYIPQGIALFSSDEGPSIGFSFWGRTRIPAEKKTEILWIFPFFYRYRKKSAYLLRKKKTIFSLYHSVWIETEKKKKSLPLLRVTLALQKKNKEQQKLSQQFCINTHYLLGDATHQLQNPHYFESLQRLKSHTPSLKAPFRVRLFLWLKKKLDAPHA